MKRSRIAKPVSCPECGEEIKNPNINYCLKCGNMIWSKAYYGQASQRFTANPAGKK